MKNRYEQILETEGKEAASAYMREIASHAKKPRGVASLGVEQRKEIMSRVRAAKNENQDRKPTKKTS